MMDPPRLPEWDPGSVAHRTLIRIVHEYRSAGWFGEYEGESDEQVAKTLRERWWEENWDDFDPGRMGYGNFSLLDTSRVIALDPEADASAANHVYVDVLGRLASITGDVLDIENVLEDWETERGRVTVSFDVNGVGRVLHLHQHDDWIDPGLISGLNSILPDWSRRFYCFDTGGQMYPVTFATPEEARALNATGQVLLIDHAPDGWPRAST